MKDINEPANSNLSLSQVIGSDKRRLAAGHIDQITGLLDDAKIPRSMIADALFEKLKVLVVPDDELDAQNATIWYAQLQRMRDDLQRQIDLIETELDRTQH